MAVSSRDRDAEPDEPAVAWHNRTSTLLAASVAGLAAIALVVALISFVARQFTEPEPAPLYYVPPSSAVSATKTGPSTTTGTITSTSPPMTSDINPGETTETPEPTTTTRSTRPPRTRETERTSDDETSTSRSRPRTNVTRTVYPAP
ncbi:Serine/threonine protein kinase [Mycobacterium sp. smrl_JER01]